MNFYGVGMKFGGTDDMWELFDSKNCWFMGYHPEERPKLDTQAISVKKGDILIAKSYGSTSQSVRAIGVVSDLEKPKDIPKEYYDRLGFSVIWIKYFKEPVKLSAAEYYRGGVHTYTIHIEKNDKFISEIKKMMKYDYKPEV